MKLLWIALGLALTLNSHAQIGETRQQIEDRLGLCSSVDTLNGQLNLRYSYIKGATREIYTFTFWSQSARARCESVTIARAQSEWKKTLNELNESADLFLEQPLVWINAKQLIRIFIRDYRESGFFLITIRPI